MLHTDKGQQKHVGYLTFPYGSVWMFMPDAKLPVWVIPPVPALRNSTMRRTRDHLGHVRTLLCQKKKKTLSSVNCDDFAGQDDARVCRVQSSEVLANMQLSAVWNLIFISFDKAAQAIYWAQTVLHPQRIILKMGIDTNITLTTAETITKQNDKTGEKV